MINYGIRRFVGDEVGGAADDFHGELVGVRLVTAECGSCAAWLSIGRPATSIA